VDEVRQIADQLGKRVVLKAQVLTGGRGRAGGIRLANSPAEAEQLARRMFGMDINGYVASKVLIDEAVEFEQQVYLGIAIDRDTAQPVIVASAHGRADASGTGQDGSEHAHRIPIDPLLGLRRYQVRELMYGTGLGREQLDFVPTALGLYQAFSECDATLVEANPLVICPDGALVSLNAKMVIDDNALFRHHDLSELRDESQEGAAEQLARRHGIHYVRLGGHVGCLSNGAGLAMATMDFLRLHGVKAANFVDIGVGAQEDKVIAGLRLAVSTPVKAVLVNIFGGVTCCDDVARGILGAYDHMPLRVPMVVRLEGTNQDAGLTILTSLPGVHVASSFTDAVEQVAALVAAGGSAGQIVL